MFVEWTQTFSCPQDIMLLLVHNGEKFDKLILINSMEKVGIPVPDNWCFADSLQLLK